MSCTLYKKPQAPKDSDDEIFDLLMKFRDVKTKKIRALAEFKEAERLEVEIGVELDRRVREAGERGLVEPEYHNVMEAADEAENNGDEVEKDDDEEDGIDDRPTTPHPTPGDIPPTSAFNIEDVNIQSKSNIIFPPQPESLNHTQQSNPRLERITIGPEFFQLQHLQSPNGNLHDIPSPMLGSWELIIEYEAGVEEDLGWGRMEKDDDDDWETISDWSLSSAVIRIEEMLNFPGGGFEAGEDLGWVTVGQGRDQDDDWDISTYLNSPDIENWDTISNLSFSSGRFEVGEEMEFPGGAFEIKEDLDWVTVDGDDDWDAIPDF